MQHSVYLTFHVCPSLIFPPQVQAEVQALGFQDSATYPDTTQLKFVMLDEFFPMHSTHRNSFCRYIRTYYVDLLGVRTENVLTFDLVGEKIITADEMNLFSNPVVDLTLLKREATNEVEKALKAVLVKVNIVGTLCSDRFSTPVNFNLIFHSCKFPVIVFSFLYR